MTDRDREPSVEARREIAQILLRHWDPLGVERTSETQDEYDAYVGPIYRLLTSGASPEQIAKHLVRVEGRMGLQAVDHTERLPVAERLSLLDVGSAGEAG